MIYMKSRSMLKKQQYTASVLLLCLAIGLFGGVGGGRLTPSAAHQEDVDDKKVATAGPNPGGNSFNLVDHNKYSKFRVRDDQKGLVMEKDDAPSGANPGGNSVQVLGDHKNVGGAYNKMVEADQPEYNSNLNVQGAEHKPENSVSVFKRFPKSSVAPSGPSHNEQLSGPSPGVGNKYTNDIGHTTEKKPMIIANRLDSGPSTGVGHWSTNGPLNEGKHNPKDIKPNKDVVSFHKLPSGPSPGAGHKYINSNVQ